ncbi:MAG: hypothetical protein COT91_04590 [Candidatus Doudnabacteria bacterium CG10_big_fil_rev_8_21_14_0_10_41_10]|uniref:Nudix hydrolase domain-containing protein n=1 Tax=Candidatus Doudnabacteria bacterium CG10_big_fil_rev_8_21_14_0_10_41_10 TaxID=1974551 RepID=A0A2H0VCK1_9BACT|nr:MAG: hypothetical protein COT91_04590 [Candidatus Doudnabacteria bacterium CG10_big_fil_rev_8_21_14_0_10_41_10]
MTKKGPSLFQRALQGMLAFLFRFLRQPWTARFYNAAAPNFALTAIETVFLKFEQGDDEPDIIEVLLQNRRDGDIPQWRGRPASPGSMVQECDVADPPCDFLDALRRVKEKELGGSSFIFTPKPVAVQYHKTARGPEIALVFVCQLCEPAVPPEGLWWNDAERLPENILPHHPDIISAAVNAIRSGINNASFPENLPN